jgi:hypothetical protein
MAWWNLPGRQDDVIGDRPADLVADALGRASALRENTAQSGPTLPELLGALGRAIARAASELEDPPTAGARVVAFTSTGEVEPSPAAQELVESLAEGIRAVALEYRERFERNPRLIELLALFAFVLGPKYLELQDLGIRPT